MKGLHSILRSASLIFIGTILGQVIGFLAEIIIIRSVGPDLLGRLGVVYALVSTIGTISLLGIPAGITRFLSADEDSKRSDILVSGCIISIISAVLFSLLLIFSKEMIDNIISGAEVGSVILLFIPYILALPVSRVLLSALRADQRTFAATISQRIGPRVCGISVLVLLITFVNRQIFTVIGYWVSIPIISSCFALFFLWKQSALPSMSLPSNETLSRLWHFSWPLAISASLTVLLTRLDLLMLGIFVNADSIGYYRSVQPLRQISTFVVGAFGFLFLPLATEYYESNKLSSIDRLYRTTTKWITSITMPFVLIVVMFPRSVIIVLLGNQYLPAASVLSILVGGLFFRAIVGLNTDILKAINQTRVELACAVAGIATNIILNLTLIPRFGIQGAAVATIMGFFVYNSCEAAIIYLRIGTHPFALNNVKPLIPTLFIGFLVSSLIGNASLDFFGLLLIGIVFSVVHLLSVIFTHSLDGGDIVVIKELESLTGQDFSSLRNFINDR